MDTNTIFEIPFDADSYIEQWLLSIDNERERSFARKHLSGSLKAMMRHTEQSYQALEDRVYAEVKGKAGRHRVYMTVVDRDKYDITNGAWFPLIAGDGPSSAGGSKDTRKRMIPETLPFTIGRFYCHGDENAIAGLMQASERLFPGTVTVSGKQYDAEFKLVQNMEYRVVVEHLYKLFQQNAITWVTLNCGYLLRFFSLQLVTAEGVNAGQELQDYSVDFEELKRYLLGNHIPVWNIQPITYNCDSFVSPSIDTLYYEHAFPMEKFGREDGYLLENNRDILSFRHTKDEILVLTMLETFQKWQAYRIIYNPPVDLYCFDRPILHNAAKDSFVSGFTKDSGMLLRSKLELIRKVNEYDLSGYLKLLDVRLLTDTTEAYDDKYMSVMNVSPAGRQEHEFISYTNLNWFLQDDLINRDEQKVLLFQFQKETVDPVWHDVLSFLLSEMQRSFAEYRCEAEVVNADMELKA